MVDLYKFYLDLAMKSVATYFAILGAIVTVVLTNVTKDDTFIVNALLVPIVMSLFVAAAVWLARPRIDELRTGIRQVGARLKVTVPVHVELLAWIVNALGPLVLLAALVLGTMYWFLLAHPPVH
jgi:hypothetical protein